MGLRVGGAETFSENKNDNKQARNSFGIAGFQMVEIVLAFSDII